ncbi:hypothetical protein JTB14_010989 [Gonioctena quinquepunctata]|nr:hypothetical protein JTB14_010989 [Gonioctena quinquepunctata]
MGHVPWAMAQGTNLPRSKSGVTRQGPSNVQVKKASAAVKDGMSQRKACEEFSMSRATLQRLLERNETEVDNYKPYKNCAVKKIFSNQEEESLVKYLLTSSKMHYGLHRNQLRFTDREEPTGSTDDPKPSTSQHLVLLNDGDDNNALAMERTAPEFTTPEQLRPYPKAKTRTMNASNPRKKKVPVEVESSEDEETYSPDSDSSEISNEICEPEERALKHGDYVLTKICGKKSIHFYVAEIINIVTNDEFQVKYLKRFGSTTKFVRENEEIFTIDKESIVLSLPQPIRGGLSERQKNMLTFGIDFASYNVE